MIDGAIKHVEIWLFIIINDPGIAYIVQILKYFGKIILKFIHPVYVILLFFILILCFSHIL